MIISIDNVSKHFGAVRALDDVSLQIPESSFFALLGPSGCGKTTLLRMIGGFDVPDQGRITIDGQDMASVEPNRRPVNMVFQSYAVFPHLSVADNIGYGLKVSGVAPEEISRRVADGIAMTKLEGLANRMPGQLSGGQRQRVALARALVKRPKVLLLDEPLSALDKKLREVMQFELIRLQREVGITFVIVTHDQAEALAMADQIAVIKEGRIAQIDNPRALYEHPKSQFVADFIGASNIFECTIDRSNGQKATVSTPELGSLDVDMAESGIKTGCLMIRPEKIRYGFPTLPDRPDEITANGTVELLNYQGDLSWVYVRLSNGRLIQCSRYNVDRIGGQEQPVGSPCEIGIDPQDLLLVAK